MTNAITSLVNMQSPASIAGGAGVPLASASGAAASCAPADSASFVSVLTSLSAGGVVGQNTDFLQQLTALAQGQDQNTAADSLAAQSATDAAALASGTNTSQSADLMATLMALRLETAAADTPSPQGADTSAASSQVQGLFGTKGLADDQPIQSLMARIPVAVVADPSATPQPQSITPEADGAAQAQAPGTVEEKVAVLLQAGSATSLLGDNSGQKTDTAQQHPLLAIAQRTNPDALSLSPVSDMGGGDSTGGQDQGAAGMGAQPQLFSAFHPATSAFLFGQQMGADSDNDNSNAQPGIAPVGSGHSHLGSQQIFSTQGMMQAALPAQVDTSLLPGTPMDQVNVRIAQAVKNGDSKIDIQLHPDNLGRIQVQIDLSIHGKANISIIADRTETLNALKSDASGLTQALNDAGIKTDTGSLQFAQRDPSGAFAFFQQNGDGSSNYPYLTPVTGNNAALPAADNALYRVYNSDRVLDIVA